MFESSVGELVITDYCGIINLKEQSTPNNTFYQTTAKSYSRNHLSSPTEGSFGAEITIEWKAIPIQGKQKEIIKQSNQTDFSIPINSSSFI